MKEVLFVEVGFGSDQHGQDATKAAVRACRNAIGTGLVATFIDPYRMRPESNSSHHSTRRIQQHPFHQKNRPGRLRQHETPRAAGRA